MYGGDSGGCACRQGPHLCVHAGCLAGSVQSPLLFPGVEDSQSMLRVATICRKRPERPRSRRHRCLKAAAPPWLDGAHARICVSSTSQACEDSGDETSNISMAYTAEVRYAPVGRQEFSLRLLGFIPTEQPPPTTGTNETQITDGCSVGCCSCARLQVDSDCLTAYCMRINWAKSWRTICESELCCHTRTRA